MLWVSDAFCREGLAVSGSDTEEERPHTTQNRISWWMSTTQRCGYGTWVCSGDGVSEASEYVFNMVNFGVQVGERTMDVLHVRHN